MRYSLLGVTISTVLASLAFVLGCSGDDDATGTNPDSSRTVVLTLVGELDGFNAEDVVVVGDYAYIANDRDQLAIVNVADRSAPVVAGNVTPHGGGNAVALAVANNYAYLAAESDAVLVFDVSQPSAPSYVTQLPAGYAKDVKVVANHVYVADQDYGLRIVDVTNMAAPQLVGSHATDDGPFAVAVSGNYAYCADNDEGLCIVDISNPASPVRAGSLTENLSSNREIAVQGDFVYISDDYTVGPVIVDVSEPSAPSIAGRFDGDCLRMVVNDGFVFSTGGYPNGGVDVVNVSIPASPKLAGKVSTPTPRTRGIAADDNYVYVAADSLFLIYSIRVADPD